MICMSCKICLLFCIAAANGELAAGCKCLPCMPHMVSVPSLIIIAAAKAHGPVPNPPAELNDGK